ncbi:MAG: DUF2807 domain-containing protein [Bacteroidales bacterium]|nr:DUF2807 domain-containing protein [Bacteroidales bacterium]
MNKYNVFLFLIFSSLFIFSCSQASKDCFKSAGDIDSTFINFDYFTVIDVNDIFNVYVEQADYYAIKIKTNSTLLNNVDVTIVDSTITITDKNKCYFSRDYDLDINIYITAPNLREINFYNASTLISINTLSFKRFLFRAYGKLAFCNIDVNCSDHFFLSLWNISGEYTISGQCNFLDILNHGTAKIHTDSLTAKYATIQQRSTGDIKVNVLNKIVGNIYDIGNIYYKGNPEIDSNIIGEGKFIKIY